MNKKTKKRWEQSFPKHKKVIQDVRGTLFRKHQLSKFPAEILIPQQFKEFNKINDILIITVQDKNIYAQVSQSSYADPTITEYSILKTLVDIAGIQCDQNGTFKGQMKLMKQVPPQAHIHMVDILVKQTYFSRRDQYKVMQALQKKQFTHFYTKKMIYFDQIQLEVTNMMRNQTQIIKSGIFDKSSKTIFRSACSKSTILVQISKQTFLLNADRQLYLQKMLQFIVIYFCRNNFFQNKHKVDIVFFSRLFYPQFETLSSAYKYLVKDISYISESQQKYQINFAVALQKDHQGRIYQDVYRRILWPNNSIEGFTQYFWEKISQFLFTINWQFRITDQAQFITNSLISIFKSKQKQEKKQNNQNKNQNKKLDRVKPFIHRLKCQVAQSKSINLFEAISLISEQYCHHYQFRSLKQTGNSITILSAGTSIYNVDQTTYKMAKSYIYLTNIICQHINVKQRAETILVKVHVPNKIARYSNKESISKLSKLVHWCIEEDIYLSPMNQRMSFKEDFEMKSAIYEDQIREMSKLEKVHIKNQYHQCTNEDKHYELDQGPPQGWAKIISKEIEWVEACHMSNDAFKVHELFYQKAVFNTNFYKPFHKSTNSQKFEIFQQDLLKITVYKQNWYDIGLENDLISRYIEQITPLDEIKKPEQITNEDKAKCQYFCKKIFDLQVLTDVGYGSKIYEDNKSQNNLQSANSSIQSYMHPQGQQWSNQKSKKIPKKDVVIPNIFELTYKFRQYEPIQQQQKPRKKKSHNKQRRRNNFYNSNLHYLMSYFSDIILQQFKKFILKQSIDNSQQTITTSINIFTAFEIQKLWKKICFPILTPIYTSFNQQMKNVINRMDDSKIADTDDIMENQICSKLMENYQIIEKDYRLSYARLSKGHICYKMIKSQHNLVVQYIIDKDRQQKMIPNMLYRYLCYEEKDYRFCCKFINFENKNYFNERLKQSPQQKSVKMVFVRQSYSSKQFFKKQPLKDFIKSLSQKYKQIKLQIFENQQKQPSKTQKFSLSLVNRNQTNRIYKSQQIQISIDKSYNIKNLFSIVINWNTCSSSLVNDFIQNILDIGRRNKLNSYLMTVQDPFHVTWSIQTIGEITFKSQTGLKYLMETIFANGWLWDGQNYYMDISGSAFIKFKKDKKLILWKDNTNLMKLKTVSERNLFYNKFFKLAAVYDLIGSMIQEALRVESSSNLGPQKDYNPDN